MRQRFKKLFIFCGAFFMFAPLFISGQEVPTTLKEKQAIDLIGIVRKFPLTEAQRDFYDQSIYDAGSDYSIKTGAVMLVKQAILQSELDYWFVKMGVEFSKRFIKAVYKILPAVTVGDYSGVIDLIEKYTVEQANKYIDDWLKQNQVLIGSGIGKYSFPSYKNNWQTINIPYIIVYSPVGANKAKIVVEFYSKTAIEPPESRGSAESNMDWATKSSWPKDRWITSKYNKNGKIEPFIVRVKGQVVKDKYGNFSWDKSVEVGLQQPSVEVEFGKAVPEIDQSDIILKSLADNQSQGFIKDKINEIKQKAEAVVNQIKNFLNIFKSSSPQAQISDFVDISQQSQEIADQADTTVNEGNATTVEQVVETMQKQVDQAIKTIATTPSTSSPQASSVQATTSVATTSPPAIATTSPPIIQPIICNQAVNQEPDFDKVIFSEIAWMGSAKSASDEWIELKNISVRPVDLNGWQIFNKTQNLKIFFTTTTIVEAGGFLLLERTNDDTVPKIKADRIYTGALANTDEMLYLVNPARSASSTADAGGSKCVLQDKIKAMPYWIEGDNITKETMERNQFFGWQTSSIVGGTPKAKNSVGKSKSSGGSGTSGASPKVVEVRLQQPLNSTSTASTTQQATSTQQATTTDSTSSPQSFQVLDVVINEIAWMGTQASPNDEWIELYNNTGQEINLTGWQITGIGTSPVLLTGKIPSRGFYLLERTSSTTISDIIEDQIYTGASSNSGEKLELKDSQGNVIDSIDCSAEWFAGDNSASTSRRTMERKSPRLTGSASTSWASNNGTTINGLDANNNLILGTPKAQNSVLENLAPEPPKDFILSQIQQSRKNSVFLTWATSTDLDTPTNQLSYFVYYSRYSKQTLDEQTATSTNVFALISTTSAVSLFLENLDFASVYYFTVRAFDGFTYSAISSTTTMATPLAPITNLMAVPSTVRGSVDLFWACPNLYDYSTGVPIAVTSYVIKMDSQPITTSSWDTAQTISQSIVPKTVGEVEVLNIGNLLTDTKIFFAIKYIGLNGQESLISDNVSATAWKGFTDNGDGTITDLRTNLTWQKDANSAINNFGASSTQDEAIAFMETQNPWRLANFKELASLIEYKPTAPSVWSDFENISPEKYWTIGKRYVGGGGYAGPARYTGWYVDFSNGFIDKSYYDWGSSLLFPFIGVKGDAIPGGMETDIFDFTNNNDGTVKDNRTGLMWLKADFAQIDDSIRTRIQIWDMALNFASNAVLCNDGTLQGTAFINGDCSVNGGVKYDDWRLPNVQEIIEITNLNGSEILPQSSFSYWSSTIFDANNFWIVGGTSYAFGAVSYRGKNIASGVQLVRDP